MKSVVIDDYHYIENGDGMAELYDFKQDPLEQCNIAQSTEGRRLLPIFRTRLQYVLRAQPATPGITAGVSSIEANLETSSPRNEARPSSQLSPKESIKLSSVGKRSLKWHESKFPIVEGYRYPHCTR